mmetsp:Transcript_1305/g.1345  ORF Transcript_1305/g.1345 Transcript_1305/m.1345 type:complete len:111 (+) Transcript_1305:132-464(+)
MFGISFYDYWIMFIICGCLQVFWVLYLQAFTMNSKGKELYNDRQSLLGSMSKSKKKEKESPKKPKIKDPKEAEENKDGKGKGKKGTKKKSKKAQDDEEDEPEVEIPESDK